MFSLPSLFLSWSLSLWAGSHAALNSLYTKNDVGLCPPASTSQVLQLQACTTTRGLCGAEEARAHFTHGATSPDLSACLFAFLPSFMCVQYLLSCVCSIFFFFNLFWFCVVCVRVSHACVCVYVCVPMKYMKHWTFVVRRELGEVGSLPPPLAPRDWTQVTRFGGSCLPAEPSHWSWTNYLNWS